MRVNVATPPVETTQVLRADRPGDIRVAANLLRAGRLVAMPTETVYGLAGNSLDPRAVAEIFRAKQRPGWDPLIVHVCDGAMLMQVVREVIPTAQRLIEAFWPGALTLLLPRHADVPAAVTAGRDLVGVRMPAHPAALELIRQAGVPLAAPSANLFGHISPTTAQHVLADLQGRIDAVLDAGPSELGVESTVLDPAAMVLYRQGGVSTTEIEQLAGSPVTVYKLAPQEQSPATLPSPGVGIRHYAPRARLILVDNEAAARIVLRHHAQGAVGLMQPEGWLAEWSGPAYPWGRWDDPRQLAKALYSGLRALDARALDTIICPLPPAGSGPLIEAIRDRLLKAARGK